MILLKDIDTAIADYRRIFPEPAPLAPNLQLAWRAARVIRVLRGREPGTRTGHPNPETEHPHHEDGCPVSAQGAQLVPSFSETGHPLHPRKQAEAEHWVPSGAQLLQHVDTTRAHLTINRLTRAHEVPIVGKTGHHWAPEPHNNCPCDLKPIHAETTRGTNVSASRRTREPRRWAVRHCSPVTSKYCGRHARVWVISDPDGRHVANVSTWRRAIDEAQRLARVEA